jgi:hypothetical protein
MYSLDGSREGPREWSVECSREASEPVSSSVARSATTTSLLIVQLCICTSGWMVAGTGCGCELAVGAGGAAGGVGAVGGCSGGMEYVLADGPLWREVSE